MVNRKRVLFKNVAEYLSANSKSFVIKLCRLAKFKARKIMKKEISKTRIVISVIPFIISNYLLSLF